MNVNNNQIKNSTIPEDKHDENIRAGRKWTNV